MSATGRNPVGTMIGSSLTKEERVAVGAFLASYSGTSGTATPQTCASSSSGATTAESAFSLCAARTWSFMVVATGMSDAELVSVISSGLSAPSQANTTTTASAAATTLPPSATTSSPVTTISSPATTTVGGRA